MNGQNIPQTMKDRPAWVCWNLVQREGEDKPDKLPVNPRTQKLASSTDPATWGTFSQALAAQILKRNTGIGFCFGDGFVGVDIDHCINTETGELSEIARDIIHTLNGYTEHSPSGTGIHIIVRGVLPEGGRRNDKIGLEMYSEGRYFTVTGDRCTDCSECPERTEELAVIHAQFMKPKQSPPKRGRPPRPTGANASDEEILDFAYKSKNGAAFQSLFEGNWDGIYETQSQADMALCNMLAFWTDRDAAAVDRLFRRSGLMRDKWGEPRGLSTYGQITVTTAVDECAKGYHLPVKHDENWMPDEEPGMRRAADVPEGNESAQDTSSATGRPLFDYEAAPADAAYHSKQHFYTMDDTGNAQRMFDLYGKNVRYSFGDKQWRIWNGKLWIEDVTGSIKRMADLVIKAMEVEAVDERYKERHDKNVKRTRSSGGKEAMVKELTHLVPMKPEDMDADLHLLNMINGVYNLETGELLPHDREKYITRIAPVVFDPHAPEPKRWLSFLVEIMDGNADLVRFLQKAAGYSLSGYTNEHCMFILHGSGRNGKSTFMEAMRTALGNYSMNAQPETVMLREKGGGSSATSDIARLKGARIVTTEEPEENRRLSEGLIKQLTGGTSVTCRFLFGKDFEYIPAFKIWLSTNHKPVIKGMDNGIWSRLRMIPFTVTFPPEKQDHGLLDKLKAELPGVLNWALQGYAMWKAEGLLPPKQVQDATAEYRGEMDIMAAFIDDCCKTEDTATCAAKDLYASYRAWAEEAGEHCMSKAIFGRRLVDKGYVKHHTATGSWYDGVKVRTQSSTSLYRRYSSNAEPQSRQSRDDL